VRHHLAPLPLQARVRRLLPSAAPHALRSAPSWPRAPGVQQTTCHTTHTCHSNGNAILTRALRLRSADRVRGRRVQHRLSQHAACGCADCNYGAMHVPIDKWVGTFEPPPSLPTHTHAHAPHHHYRSIPWSTRAHMHTRTLPLACARTHARTHSLAHPPTHSPSYTDTHSSSFYAGAHPRSANGTHTLNLPTTGRRGLHSRPARP
jgi:hypothetical protein